MAATRYSKQRELIYHAVASSKEHPTAEMVFRALRPENPSLSLATVYRNLNLMAREGRLARMPFPVERYDADLSPHTHFVCARCARVLDLELPYDPELDVQAGQWGHQIAGHSLLFTGLCAQCRQSDEETCDAI